MESGPFPKSKQNVHVSRNKIVKVKLVCIELAS